MADTKYRKKYCKDVVEYFERFIEMRDDPRDRERDLAERQGMVAVKIENGKPVIEVPPCSGYPTLTKFAIKIGVTPRTLRNWRDKYPQFDEACEFAEEILSDVLDERALTGQFDGRAAMKIRELRANQKSREGDSGGARLIVNFMDPVPRAAISAVRLPVHRAGRN